MNLHSVKIHFVPLFLNLCHIVDSFPVTDGFLPPKVTDSNNGEVLKLQAGTANILQPKAREETIRPLQCPPMVTFRANGKPLNISCQLLQTSPVQDVVWRYSPFGSLNHTMTLLDTNGPNYSKRENGDLTLTIHAAGYNHAGIYECDVQFASGVTMSDRVALKLVPFVLQMAKVIRVDRGDPTTIECIESGTPNVTLLWSLDNVAFPANNSRVQRNNKQQPSGLIIFDSVEYADAGNYTCVAVGESGNDTTSTVLKVKDPLRWFYPLIGIFICILVLVGILGTDDWLRRKYPDRVTTEPSDTSVVVTASAVTHQEGTRQDSLPLSKMLQQAKDHGYPHSVVYAAVKWRAKVEERKRSNMVLATRV
ncbi:neuroplastin-like [Paramacrobiotus metropolitanus]|uniref:neuroplastin-like n=1 Tax=Paramacrobiotus metropolitanus TaxID=2943436 RepID=UPI0024464D85|nr:neuroplastin-like [Paramacrobiotus metropolitanus]